MKTFRKFLGPCIIIATFAWMAWILYAERASLAAIPWRDSTGPILWHLTLMVLFIGMFLLGWRFVLTASGLKVTRKTVWGAWLAPNIGKYLPGKVGMLIGRIEICRAHGIPRGDTLGAFVAEHVLSVGSAAPYIVLIAAGGLVSLDQKNALLVLAAASGACLMVLRPQVIVWALNLLMKASGRNPVTFRLRSRSLLLLFPFYVVLWAVYGFAGYMLCEMVSAGNVPAAFAVGAFVVSWLIGFLSFLPGGFGAREWVLASLLGVFTSSGEAVAIALVSRISWTLMDLIGVAVGTAILTRQGSADPEK